MSTLIPKTPSKKRVRIKYESPVNAPADNHKIENDSPKSSDHISARNFALWYKRMMDYDRNDLGPYLADDVVCHIFGKKIKTRKKVIGYLKYILDPTCHDFVTIKSKNHLTSVYEYDRPISPGKNEVKSPPISISPEIVPLRKRSLRLRSDSSPVLNSKSSKRPRISNEQTREDCNYGANTKSKNLGILQCTEHISEVNNKGDGVSSKKRKIITITPPNLEVGQGDCLPSTSSSDSKIEQSNAYAYSQLAHVPRKVVECECFIKFIKNDDRYRSERKCKLQISYSEDPLNIGEYIVWAIYYTGEMKCRKNLLPLFDQLGMDDE